MHYFITTVKNSETCLLWLSTYAQQIAMLNTVKWVTLTLTFSSQLADNSIICFSHLPLSLPNDYQSM